MSQFVNPRQPCLTTVERHLCLVMSARQELNSLHSQLRAEFNSETANQQKCADILEKLKVYITIIFFISMLK